ncbi:MAG TPA: hypothetical protein PKC99_15765 [Anaerolineales bacterium]|nr:MAG: hypothetical protein QY324_06005 [Anaerolineales bacterium]HMN00466.1 hypothetical protein [Anaerolineales bacterium]
MKKIAFASLIVLLFSACAPTLTPVPSPVGESPTPAATRTPVPPTATVTPMPQLTLENLKSMSVEDKLKMAPQAESAPEDAVSSFAAGESARDIAWSGKSLTFWDRVVAYEGTTKSGEKVTLYYDLESGQWAKQYADFDEVSKIPADEAPDVMVVNDENGAHLVRNKLQYDYDWISQPQVMIEGKMVFRDEKGYPKAVFDTNTGKWMTPEEADVVITKEKWIEILSQYSWVGKADGKKIDGSEYLKNFLGWNKVLTDKSEITDLPVGSQFLIFNPSGEITYWVSKEEAMKRLNEGAIVEVFYRSIGSPDILAKIAFQQWQAGNKNIFLTFGDVGVTRSQISGIFITGEGISISDIPQTTDKQGLILSPVMRPPKHIEANNTKEAVEIRSNDPLYWLNDLIDAGATFIHIGNLP